MTRQRGPSIGRVITAALLLMVQSSSAAGAGETAFDINGTRFVYRLGQLARHAKIHSKPVERVAPGQTTLPFLALVPTGVFASGHTQFGTSISCMKHRVDNLEQLPAQARPGGEAEHMFFPASEPTEIAYRKVGARRWLVSTRFQDREKQFVRNRTYWTIQGDLLVTFNINFTANSPKNREWRQRRMETLDRLVRDFAIEKKLAQ